MGVSDENPFYMAPFWGAGEERKNLVEGARAISSEAIVYVLSAIWRVFTHWNIADVDAPNRI